MKEVESSCVTNLNLDEAINELFIGLKCTKCRWAYGDDVIVEIKLSISIDEEVNND